MRARRFLDELMAEVILYGGLPARRGDVYRDAFARTGDWRIADRYAFGPRATIVDLVPLTREQLAALP